MVKTVPRSTLNLIFDPGTGIKQTSAAAATALERVSLVASLYKLYDVTQIPGVIPDSHLALMALDILNLGTIIAPTDELRNALELVGLAGDGIALLTVAQKPEIALLTINSLIWGHFVANELYKLAEDPPEGDYTSFYIPPSEIGLPVAPLDDPHLSEAFHASTQLGSLLYAYLHAINVSQDRYGAALLANDPGSATLQLQAILHYLFLFNEAAGNVEQVMADLDNALDAVGEQFIFEPHEIDAILSTIVANGFSEDLQRIFEEEFMLSQDAIRDLLFALSSIDPTSFSQGPIDFFSTTATAFQLVHWGSEVPEPPLSLLFLTGIGVLLIARRRYKIVATH